MSLPREIKHHWCSGLNDHINVMAMDGPGSGGASHYYRIEPIAQDHPQGAIHSCEIKFQHGPIAEQGVNGLSIEALLAVVIDRLEGFQNGDFRCRENALALTKIQEAMHWLQHRTRSRLDRGVEGTSKP